MREVARLAGTVHPSTVSLALRNSPRVSPEVRSKIQAIARRIGYRRDPLLDAFNQHRLKTVSQRASRHIAAISDFSSMAELVASPVHAAARTGALTAAEHLHCQLDFFFCGPGQPSPRRLDAVLEARGLRALLLFGINTESPDLDFTWSRTCTVAIDSLQLSTPLYRVTPDYREATRLLWRRAWAQGYKRIGIIRSNPHEPVTEDRAVAGFLLEQMRQPHCRAIPVVNLTEERGSRIAFKAWLQVHEPQIIFHSTASARLLAQLIASHDILSFAFDTLSPAEPGVCPDYIEVGRYAVEQLVTLMQTNQLGPPPSPVCTYVAVNLPN
jgi:LacI family transcriptional regulator